jgi:O-antigen ligase
MIFFYLLVAVMPLTRHPIWGEFIGDLTGIKYVGVACMLYALFYLGHRQGGRPKFFETPQSRWFLAFMATSTVTYLIQGEAPTFGESPLASYISFFGLFFVTLVVIDSEERLRAALLAGGVSIGLASIYVLRGWQKAGFADRPGWVTGDPNYYTLSALLILPILFQLYRQRRSPTEGYFCLACLLLTFVAMAAAASRGGFLGFTAMALFMAVRFGGRRGRVLVALALVLGVALVSPVSPIGRFINPDRSDDKGVHSRLALWRAGLEAAQRSPILGIGQGRFVEAAQTYGTVEAHFQRVAHNTYIHLLAEQGLLGLGLFLMTGATTFLSLERVRRRTARFRPMLLYEIATAMQASLIGYAVAAGFVSAVRQKFYWLVVCLSMCVAILEPVLTQRAQARAGAMREDARTPSTRSRAR